jgi:hypothetical protein
LAKAALALRKMKGFSSSYHLSIHWWRSSSSGGTDSVFSMIFKINTVIVFSLIFKIFIYYLLCWVGLHWHIYKGSYSVSNVAYLNSPLPLLFHSASPDSYNSFTDIIFAFTHGYTLFASYSSSYPLHHYLPLPDSGQNLLVPPSCSLIL